MIRRLPWFIALLCLGYGLSQAGELPEINFNKIVFSSGWTKSGKVQLVNGEYREPAAPGSATQIVVRLTEPVAFGKLDGKEAAAVILVTDPGGSGSFYDLALLVKEPQGWINQDVTLLGDRIQIYSLAFANDAIVVGMTTHAPGDAMCCPTLQRIQRFAVKEHRLIKAGEEGGAKTDQMLVGTVWQWQQTLYNDDTKTIPSDPDKYTLKLLPDGKVSIRADCNVGGGVYQLRNNELSIDIKYSTRAACPPESLDQDYVRDLNGTALYFIRGDMLSIDLKYDTGTMTFSPAKL